MPLSAISEQRVLKTLISEAGQKGHHNTLSSADVNFYPHRVLDVEAYISEEDSSSLTLIQNSGCVTANILSYHHSILENCLLRNPG